MKLSIVLLLSTLGLNSLQTVNARPPNDDPVIVMTGSTTFKTLTTSRALVQFPQKVDVINDLKHEVTGDGRVRGFVLRKVGAYRRGNRPLIQSVHLGLCSRKGCASRETPSFMSGQNVGRKISGLWELYVIADGARVSLEFQVSSLKGSNTWVLREPARSEIRSLTPTVHEGIAHTLYSAGAFSRLADPDFGLVGIWFEGQPHAAGAFGSCIHENVPTRAQETAFLPGCPNGEGQLGASTTPSTGPWDVFFMASRACCTKGLGGWYSTASKIIGSGGVAFWIDYSM